MSLSSFCLKVIKSNFDVFMSDFVSLDGKVPRWHFEFLQRQYSKELLYPLSEKHLPDHYYSFFINAHLKELTVPYYLTAEILIQRLTEVGHTVVTLDMEWCPYSEDEMKKLVSLVPNIELLILAESNSDDATIKAINSHAPLHSLNVRYCRKITNVGLKYLCEKDKEHKLKHLIMEDTKITKEGVMFSLVNFPSLETLDHRDVAHTLYNIYINHYLENTLDTVPKFNLTTLTFIEEYATDKKYPLVEVLKAISFLCPKLLSLSLLNFKSPVAVRSWDLFSNLQEINLDSLVKIDFTAILESRGPYLKKITLENGKLLTDSLLKCLKLEYLCISHIDLEPLPENLKSQWDVHKFEKMEFLSFEMVKLWKSVLALVKSSPNLQSLSFEDEEISSEERFIEDVCSLECISILKQLSFSSIDITLAGIKKILVHTKSLSDLCIVGCSIPFAQYQEYISSIKAENSWLNVRGRP